MSASTVMHASAQWPRRDFGPYTYRQNRRYDRTKSHRDLLQLHFIKHGAKNHEAESLPLVELAQSYNSGKHEPNDSRDQRAAPHASIPSTLPAPPTTRACPELELALARNT
jgi:hypothetical protein